MRVFRYIFTFITVLLVLLPGNLSWANNKIINGYLIKNNSDQISKDEAIYVAQTTEDDQPEIVDKQTNEDDLLFNNSEDLDEDDLLIDDSSEMDDNDLFDLSLDNDNQSTSSSTNEQSQNSRNQLNESAINHLDLFAETRYPSANTCKVCHPKQYKQWSVSQHAYAQLSPIYMAMQNTINQATSSTNGDFCIRCHNQVGMNMGESTSISNLERHPTSREGITCVVCHRIEQEYGKASGRVAIVEGDLLTKVYGPTGDKELNRVLENRHDYRVITDPDKSGRKIHTKIGHFKQLNESSFCGVCHDVNLFNGFRFEEAFSEYKNSPAAEKGISCQDCHMGKEQGVAGDYDFGPAAIIGGKNTKPRKLTNHFFAGPDYSVIHPGIFPHNSNAAELATLQEWLEFDYLAGWGTDNFEDQVSEQMSFPERWQSIDARYDARAILDEQFELLEWARQKRLEVLRNGYGLGEIIITKATHKGIKFKIEVRNKTDGHNVPTGFDAERLVWLSVTVSDEKGEKIFQSGDLDPNGDLRDNHSLYVHRGEIPLDKYLFNLQSKFITKNARGGEREQVLAVNYSPDPLPFIRPFSRSIMLAGQPDEARKHRKTLPPLTGRWAKYKVNKNQLTDSSNYKIQIELKSAAVPVNLINAIKGVGFDFAMTAKDVADNLVSGQQTIWRKSVEVELH